MSNLPINIEQLLTEAGFTATEILVLRHVFTGDMFTIRELAAKTGKSCGALDGAIKKLLRKNILCKELINTTQKYILRSTDAISLYLKKETLQQCNLLKRRTQDVQAFLESMELKRTRPDMQYYDGLHGIEQAYSKLIEEAGAEDMLMYIPIQHKEEENPQREMLTRLFQQRKKQGVFLRVLTHSTPLARRFQARDPYENRKTMFIDPERNPLHCEQIIAGKTFTYIDHVSQRACMITFPELVHTERALFESLWNEADEHMPLSDYVSEEKSVQSTWQKIFIDLRNVCLCQGATVTTLLLFATIYAICSVALSTNYGFCPAT